ncbi:MAG: AMP-binding protein [Gammaproteobacteria bacterium]|nr:AMP-binding protein [Gammaproteobacteria bacterium]
MTNVSLSTILAYWSNRLPNGTIALVHEETRVTWRELDAVSNRLARAYLDLGVKPNDFVTIALPNGIEFVAATFATWKLGATPQPVSAKLPKFERDQLIELCHPSLVIGVPDEDHPDCMSIPIGYDANGQTDAPLDERIADSFKAMTSGGSTGRPKLIVSTTPARWDVDGEFLGFQTAGSVLIPGPLYHNGPFMWGMIGLFKGNQITITTRFDADQTLRIIEEERVDTVYMVPTMMQRIWNLPDEIRTNHDLSSLKTLWHLAAPCPPWLKEAFIDWLGADVIWELYGGTEGQGSTTISGEEWLAHRGSVGRPGPTCKMQIVDDDGTTLGPREVGEIFILPETGQGSTYRYIGAEAKAMEGGWESLGDMGYMDEEGYLYLTDRQTDMILSGGANIYPAEIEGAIEAFTGVRSCAVIGLPDDDLGNVVHAIVDAPNGDVAEEDLLAHLAERLVRYKIPRSLEFTNEPLRDDAGKVRRKQLRAERIEQT